MGIFKDKRRVLSLLLAGIISLAWLPTAFSGEKRTIVVIRSRVLAPYNDAFLGFKEELKEAGYNIAFKVYNLNDAQGKEEKFVQEVRALEPDLVFALGTEAALFAKRKIKQLPKVFSMVLNPVESGVADSLISPGDNLTGVSLNIPVEVQFKKLKEMLPQAKKIGMLYDAAKRAGVKKEAAAAAEKLGLHLIAKPVRSEAEVVTALQEILKETDCLWASIDTLIYNPQSAKHILLATLRSKSPFMAFSSHYVKAGALLALESDYYDIGRQSGELAIKIWEGRSPRSLPVSLPRKTRLVINQRTANIIGIIVPEKLLNEAAEIFGRQSAVKVGSSSEIKIETRG